MWHISPRKALVTGVSARFYLLDFLGGGLPGNDLSSPGSSLVRSTNGAENRQFGGGNSTLGTPLKIAAKYEMRELPISRPEILWIGTSRFYSRGDGDQRVKVPYPWQG